MSVDSRNAIVDALLLPDSAISVATAKSNYVHAKPETGLSMMPFTSYDDGGTCSEQDGIVWLDMATHLAEYFYTPSLLSDCHLQPRVHSFEPGLKCIPHKMRTA